MNNTANSTEQAAMKIVNRLKSHYDHFIRYNLHYHDNKLSVEIKQTKAKTTIELQIVNGNVVVIPATGIPVTILNDNDVCTISNTITNTLQLQHLSTDITIDKSTYEEVIFDNYPPIKVDISKLTETQIQKIKDFIKEL